jgi:hypothetical protein
MCSQRGVSYLAKLGCLFSKVIIVQISFRAGQLTVLHLVKGFYEEFLLMGYNAM